MHFPEWQRNISISNISRLYRNELPFCLGSSRFCSHPIRFDAVLAPDRYDCPGRCQLLHDLVPIEIGGGQTFIPPNAPSLSLKKRRKLRRQCVISLSVADEDIGHRVDEFVWC